MMKAAIYDSISTDFSTLRVEDVAIPSVKEGQVLVSVKVASINPIDHYVHAGFMASAGWPTPFPFIPGYDFAGTVEALGEGVSDFKKGDRVYAVNWGKNQHFEEGQPCGGAFAEYCIISSSKLSLIPESVSFDDAAAIALVGTTAYESLMECGKISNDSRILILGGSSAVGTTAIQIAKNKDSS